MMAIQINGYTIEVKKIYNRETSFIILTDEQGKRHYFNMEKPNGKWVIRNSETVPSFIVKIEKDISKLI